MTHSSLEKAKHIQTAAVTALVGNGFLASLKIGAGLFARSSALIGDGIDSLADVFISIMTLVVVKLMSKPADAQHPWGHGRMETITTAILSFILFFMGTQLTINAASRIALGETTAAPSVIATVVTVISIAGKALLAGIQRYYGKRSGSAMIMANAKNMSGDILISLGVLVGLVISALTGVGIADSIIAMLIGAWIIKTSVGIFLDVNQELMDGGKGTDEYQRVFDAVKSVSGTLNPHRARMRRIAGYWDIDIDIEVDPQITVREAHDIASQVEDVIKERLENVYDIVVHVEPYGDSIPEGYGLSEKDMIVPQ